MIDKRIYQLLRTGKFTQFLLLYGIGKRPYKRVNKIIYDEKPQYAGDNFINKSTINWQYINRG